MAIFTSPMIQRFHEECLQILNGQEAIFHEFAKKGNPKTRLAIKLDNEKFEFTSKSEFQSSVYTVMFENGAMLVNGQQQPANFFFNLAELVGRYAAEVGRDYEEIGGK